MNDNLQQTPYCAIGLCNPKSPSNVGSVIRACGCFTADEILYTGTRYDRAEPFYTDTANHKAEIPPGKVDDLMHAAHKHPVCGRLTTVCVELCENAIPLPDFQHPARAVYLFGPEDSSLSQEIINAADHVVFIPTNGCLNLSASVNVVLYDRSVKLDSTLNTDQYNNLVRHSRDCNNNLSVRS